VGEGVATVVRDLKTADKVVRGSPAHDRRRGRGRARFGDAAELVAIAQG
jgi:hypothetical protein